MLSLALGERSGWAPIAGFSPTQDVSFTPGATFGLSTQGLLVYLGAGLLVGATMDDVMPAWREFMVAAPALMNVGQINEQVILWIARIVFHHIGSQPLGSVGDRASDEIDRLVAGA